MDYRSQFDSLSGCCHLISNSLGAMPNASRAYADEYARVWQTRGVRAWRETWWEMPRTVGDKLAELMGAAPDSVSMHLNVTSAQATVQSCFDLATSRNKVVMVDMEFPSILYLYREWLRGRGELCIIPSEDSISVDIGRVEQAIDERTLLVPISHVLFRSSYIVDAKRLIMRAHAHGALVVLDAFQSLGVVPLNVVELDVDFVVGGCLKWLCGGPGACFLYVNPRLQNSLSPRFTGWMAHENPFLFDIQPITHAKGSYKFMNGTANIPALYTCRAGLEIISEIGVPAIRKRSTYMTSRIIEQCVSRGWKTSAPADPNSRAGTVSIDVPNGREIAAELNARDILVDFRPKSGIRLSPHFYNTDDEITHALEEIEDIIRDESWRRHADHVLVVT